MKTSMKIGIVIFLAVVVVAVIVGISVLNSEPTQNEPIQNGGNNVVTDNKEENNTPINTELTVDAVKRAKETPASQFEYEDVEGGVAITGYNGKAEIVVIPEKINGKDVVEIGKYAFANNIIIQAVKLPDTVTHVFNNVFTNCSNLKIFVAGSNLKMLGEYVFNYCVSLNEVELNDGLEEIQFGCFSNNNIRELYIPSSVTRLDAPIYVSDKDSITIVSAEGSEAEKYANKIGLKFKTNQYNFFKGVKKITVIGESGSYVETNIKKLGERYGLEFKAK